MITESSSRWQPEGFPLNEYRLLPLILAFIPSLFFFLYNAYLYLTSRPEVWKTADISKLPDNTLYFAFHPEMFLWPIGNRSEREFQAKNMRYMGLHSFISYAASSWVVWRGFKSIRFSRKIHPRPMEHILGHLRKHVGPFFVRTDSGKPYGVVRKSVVDLAVATERPVAALHQRLVGGLSIRINGHVIPLGFNRIESRISDAIPVSELKKLDRTNARDKLQALIEQLHL